MIRSWHMFWSISYLSMMQVRILPSACSCSSGFSTGVFPSPVLALIFIAHCRFATKSPCCEIRSYNLDLNTKLRGLLNTCINNGPPRTPVLCANERRHVPGRRTQDTCYDHGLSRRSLRANPLLMSRARKQKVKILQATRKC